MKFKNNARAFFCLFHVNSVGFSHSAIFFLGPATAIAVCAGEDTFDMLRRIFYVLRVLIYIIEE
jgi:hypothetical protein